MVCIYLIVVNSSTRCDQHTSGGECILKSLREESSDRGVHSEYQEEVETNTKARWAL